MTAGPRAELGRRLAEFAAGTGYSALPPEVVDSVRMRVLDVIGLCVAARELPTSAAILQHVRDQGGRPQAHVIGAAGGPLPAPLAALANGVLAHSLDYDDTHLPSVLHPSAAVVPAALAAAEPAGASGREVIRAIAIGLEVCVRLGMAGYDERAGNSVFFEHGQHATSICGTLGGAVAAALLLGLPAAGVLDALGVAASMASGLIEGNRTGGTVKRLHCGWAAQSAVTAAQLARRGFSGPPTVLEGRFGFFRAFLRGEYEAAEITKGLGADWAVPGIFFKLYPANHFTHAAVEAALALRARGLRPSRVESVTLGVPAPVLPTIGQPIERKRTPETAGRAHVDYAFHLAPMSAGHIAEIPDLVERFGIPSFKIFMFYGGHGLHGRSADQSAFLMIPEDERYDYAHFEFVMRGVQAARERFPELAGEISLSLHCETAEIMTAYTRMVEEAGEPRGLAAYHASRPPHSEGLAVCVAAYLAHETGLPNINLLHLSSRKAVDAAVRMAEAFPHIDFRREVTIGHLLADITTAHGLGGKVNPPLRPREDVEALWEYVADGTIDWVVSDHACCRDEIKFGTPRDDVFVAKSGFGGAEYLLAGMVTEARRRGVPGGRIAALTAWNPARRYGLRGKGAIAAGLDADFCLVDPAKTWTVRAADSESAQEYSPFEGFELTAKVTDTFVRGHHVLDAGKIVGDPVGRYVHRPTR